MLNSSKILFLSILFHFASLLNAQTNISESDQLQYATKMIDINIDTSFKVYKTLFNNAKNNAIKNEANLGIINCMLQKNRIDTSLELLTKAYKHFTENRNIDSTYYYQLALLNVRVDIALGAIDDAFKKIKEVKTFFSIKNDTMLIYRARYAEITLYQNLGNKDTSLLLANKLYDEIVSNKPNGIKLYYQLSIAKGYIQRDFQNYEQANKAVFPVLQYVLRLNNRYVPNMCLLLAQNYFELKNFDSSKYFVNAGITCAEKLGLKNQLEILYARKFFVDSALGLKDTAIKDLRIAFELQRENFNSAKGKLISEFEAKLENQKLAKENVHLNTQKQKLITALAFGLLVIISSVTLIVLIRRKNKQLEKLVSFRNYVFTIISHDFRSPLFALHDLTNQVAYTVKKQNFDKLTALANGISESSLKMSNLLNNLLNLAYTNKAPEPEAVNLFELLDETKELYNTILQNKSIVVSNFVNHNTIISIKKNVLELIVRNWLDNTLKYSNLSFINFSVHSAELSNTIFIENDGEILPKTKESILKQIKSNGNESPETAFGLGLSLIAEYSKKEDWLLNLESNNNKTIFSIKIKK